MIIEQEKNVDYYNVGDSSNMVLSNSALKCLDPETGGSPQKFLSFFEKQAEKDSRSLENGRILHAYVEKPDTFAIASTPKPTETLGELCDELVNFVIHGLVFEGSLEITSDKKKDRTQSADILKIKESYEQLGIALGYTFENTLKAVRYARLVTNAYKSYNEDTVVDLIKDKGLDYIKQSLSNNGKTFLSVADKDKIEGCIASLRANTLANKFLGLSGMFDTNIILKEFDIYVDFLSAKYKGRLDNVYIDTLNKVVYISDLKTTAKALGYFKSVVESYKYYRQLALYRLLFIEAVRRGKLDFIGVDIKDYPVKIQIIAVETTDYYNCCIYNLDSYIPMAGEELAELFKRYKTHVATNNWKNTMEEMNNAGTITLRPSNGN